MFSLRQPRLARWRFSPLVWFAVVTLAMVPACSQKASADEQIWSGLILAKNVDSPTKPSPEVARFSGTVQQVFGYNQLVVIGSAAKSIDDTCERWIVPSQNFWFGVKSKKMQDNNYLLDVSLFHDRRCLVETQVKLGRSTPLIIRGPMHARGQLLIVLQVLP